MCTFQFDILSGIKIQVQPEHCDKTNISYNLRIGRISMKGNDRNFRDSFQTLTTCQKPWMEQILKISAM